MASTDARPIPQKNVAYRVTFPILDADGDLVTGATSLDSEISKDGGTFADCTNEATEIATSSGMYYLDLTSTEMNADTVAIIVKSGNGKTTPIVLYPEEAGDIRVNLTQILGTAVATPATAGILDVNAKNWNNLATVDLPLAPTTAGRKLDVSTGGEAGIDWANIGSPTTTVGLSGTTVKTATDVETDTQDIQARLPSALGANGNMKADVRDFNGAAGTFAAGRPEVNTSHIGGTAQTAGDLPGRLTAARAGYLDNLNIGGAVAGSSEVTGLNVNTRANLLVPIEIETPDAGTQVYKIRLHLYDPAGNMEAPDSTPTVALTNAAGTDRSARLSAASNPSTGVYTWDYTATAGDAEEQLVWIFSVVEGGVTRTYPANSYVVEETAYRFTSSDRANLNAVLTDTNELQTDWANGGRLDNILDSRASQTSVDTVDGIVDSILVDTAEIGAAGAGLTAVPWNVAWDAEVESEVTDALAAYDPPTRAEATADKDAVIAAIPTSNVTAIKAKTDQLTFTTPGEVDSNVQSVNDVAVTGTGAVGDEWGP